MKIVKTRPRDSQELSTGIGVVYYTDKYYYEPGTTCWGDRVYFRTRRRTL